MRSVKKFKTIVDFVWKRRKNYLRGCFEDNEEDWTRCLDEPYFFDFPEYGGLPNKISKTLSSEFVDAMQYVWEDMSKNNLYSLQPQNLRSFDIVRFFC